MFYLRSRRSIKVVWGHAGGGEPDQVGEVAHPHLLQLPGGPCSARRRVWPQSFQDLSSIDRQHRYSVNVPLNCALVGKSR